MQTSSISMKSCSQSAVLCLSIRGHSFGFPSHPLGSRQLINGYTLDRHFLAPTTSLLGHALKELLHSELKARNFESKVLLFYLQKQMRGVAIRQKAIFYILCDSGNACFISVNSGLPAP